MEDAIFPPSPSWFLPNIINTREDGSVCYGSKNNVVLIKLLDKKKSELSIIQDAHNLRVTAVAFSPSNCSNVVQNTIVSCGEDGFVKLWDINTLGATIGHKSHWEQKENVGKIVSLDWSIANPCYIVSAADNNSVVLWDILSNCTVKFVFQRLGITVISCCPYSEKIVAVGGKSGQIYILRLTGSGDIIYRLRGHDNLINSLSWCPVPYNIFKTNEIYEEFLLASACQNKEIFVWRIGSDGKCEIKFQVPTSALKNSPQSFGKVGNYSSFTALNWLEPHKIYLSSSFGELIYFDIKSYISRTASKDISGTANKDVSGTPSKDESGTASKDESGTASKDESGTASKDESGTVSKDESGTASKDESGTASKDVSRIASKDMSTTESKEVKTEKKKNCMRNFFKLGHYCHTKGLYAIAGPRVKVEIVLHKKMNIESELQIPMKSSISNIIIKESDKHGDEDWTWKLIKSESPQLLWTAGQDRKLVACDFISSEVIFSYHTMNGVVYCAVVSPHDSNKIAIGVGDGMIRLWNMTQSSGEIQIYWEKVKDRVMALNWHPVKDGLLAYGTSEGRVGLIDTKSNKLPKVFKPGHSQPIYSLSWGPQFTFDNSETTILKKLEFELYVIGDNTLLLYNASKPSSHPVNLSKIIPFPCNKQTDVCWKPDYSIMAVGNDDGSICLLEPPALNIVFTLFSYKKLIQSIAWHPSSTSIDSGLSSFHGYFTAGSTDNDCEIRVFDCKRDKSQVKVELAATLKGHHGYIISVSWCPHVSCRLVSTSADYSVQIWDVISQSPLVNFMPSGAPMFSIWSPIDPDFVLTGCRSDVLCIWKVSDQTKVFPVGNAKTKKKKKGKNIQMSVSKEVIIGEAESDAKEPNPVQIGSLAETKKIVKSSKEVKMFSSKNFCKEDINEELKTCFSLLKENGEQNYSIPFLCDDDYFMKSIDDEEALFKKSNNWCDFYELALWRGNIKDVLEEKIINGELNDFLVSLAPSISPRVWQQACLSYSKTLEEKKFYRKAASYLILCHKIYEAIHMLANANLYLEALCIARSRLPISDPILKEICRKYAEWLFKNGSVLKACECYIYLRDYKEVAKICGRKNQVEYLRLAALAAKKCSCHDLESMEATCALFKCLETNNLDSARQICQDHFNLKHLNFTYFIYNTLVQLDEEKLVINVDILSYIRESFDIEKIIIPNSLQKSFHKYAFYKKKEEVFTIVTEELTFAACSKNTDEVLSHLTRALSTCCRYLQTSDSVHLLYKLCLWLSPEGFLSSNSLFVLQNNSKVKSMRAFLAASIVRHLNDNHGTEDISKYFELISELKEDILDPDSYKYFQNLLEVEICEKRLLKNRRKLTKKPSENGIIQNHPKSNPCANSSDLTSNDLAVVEDIKVISEENVEVGANTAMDFRINVTDNENNERILKKIRSGVGCDIESDLEERVAKDLDLLKTLKTEIENFESVRISSPNPVPVYFMLKKFCEGAFENEFARLLLKDLNEKWEKLN